MFFITNCELKDCLSKNFLQSNKFVNNFFNFSKRFLRTLFFIKYASFFGGLPFFCLHDNNFFLYVKIKIKKFQKSIDIIQKSWQKKIQKDKKEGRKLQINLDHDKIYKVSIIDKVLEQQTGHFRFFILSTLMRLCLIEGTKIPIF